MSGRPESPLTRALATTGALLCALSVAMGAYAAHLADASQRGRLDTAVQYAFLHGLALLALAPTATGARLWAMCGLLAGVLLFSGSLAAAALAGGSTALAPLGGGLLIVSWLLLAAGLARPRYSAN